MKMRKVIALSVFCGTLVAAQVAFAIPTDPNPASFWLTENYAGTDDVVGASVGGVDGNVWVRVFNDAAQTTMIAEEQANADGSVDEFSIGDGSTVNGVDPPNGQASDLVYVWAWDGVDYSAGYITLDNDVTGPVPVSAATYDSYTSTWDPPDGIQNGHVDNTAITFNEEIWDANCTTPLVFSYVEIDGQVCSDFNTGDTANDTVIEFWIINPALQVPGTDEKTIDFNDHDNAGITDALGNEALDFSLGAIDLAPPCFVYEIEDVALDTYASRTVDDKEVVVYVSENINAAEAVQEYRYRMTQFYIAPFNVAYVAGMGWGSQLTITVSENYTYSWNTDATGTDEGTGTNNLGVQQSLVPTVYVHNLDLVHDLNGNAFEQNVGQGDPFEDIIDNAPPVHIYGEYRDTNSDGTVNEVAIVYSEQVTASIAAAFDVDNIATAESSTLSLDTYGDWGDFHNSIELGLSPEGTNDLTYYANAMVSYAPGDVNDIMSIPCAAFIDYPLEDAAPPQLTDSNSYDEPIAYFDTDGDGTIDEVTATFTEDVICNTVLADWGYDENDLPGFMLTGPFSCNGTVLTIDCTANANVTGICSIADTEPTLTYLADVGSIADAAGNELPAFAGVSVLDVAAPLAYMYEYFDTDDPYPNGDIDYVLVTYTECVAFGYALGDNWSLTPGDLGMVLDPMDIPAQSSNTEVTFPVVCVTDMTGVNDGIEPVLTFDDSGTGYVWDHVANPAVDQTMVLVDMAPPYKLTAYYYDNIPSPNGQIDNFVMDFTEDIDYIFNENDWDVITPGDLNLGDITDIEITGSTLQGFALGDPCKTGTDDPLGDEPSVLYLNTVNDLSDGKGNVLIQISTGLSDRAPSVPCAFEDYIRYEDPDEDGTIDLVHIEFSEHLVDFSYSAADWNFDPNPLSFVITSWDLTDYILEFEVASLADVTGVDGGDEPDICYTDNACNVKDWQDNCMDSGCWDIVDRAGPILLDNVAFYDNNVDGTVETIVTNWTENLIFDCVFNTRDACWEFDDNDDLNLEIVSAIADGDQVTFTVNADELETGCNGIGEPEISYNNLEGHITDTAEYLNEAPSSGSRNVDDMAAPLCYEFQYYDEVEVDGSIDLVEIEFTEDLFYFDFLEEDWSFDPNPMGFTIVDWDLDDSTLWFLIEGDENETGVNGGAEPNVCYTNNDCNVTDERINCMASGCWELTDRAAPVMIDDVAFFDNDVNGTVETVVVNWTENIIFNCTFPSRDDCWELDNNADLNLDLVAADANGSQVTFTVDSDVLETGCDINGDPEIAYFEDDAHITDTVDPPNIADDTGWHTINDMAPPFCFEGYYFDSNVNGAVDRVDLSFTEYLAGFSYQVADWPIDGGDLDLGIYSASVITNSVIRFQVEGNQCMTGVDDDIGQEPVFNYDLNTSPFVRDAANNLTDDFARTLVDQADPVLKDCDGNPIAYVDQSHNGVVDHIFLRYSEQVYSTVVSGVWSVYIPLIDYYPNPTTVSGSGSTELDLTGFSVPAFLTHFDGAEIDLMSATAVRDADFNFAPTFNNEPMADEALPVAYIVTPESDPIYLGETQYLELVFSELVVQDGSSDPVVAYSTTGDVQHEVACSTGPEWVAYFYPQFPNIVQSQYGVYADETITFGETGDAWISVDGAMDEDGNPMAVCPPYPDEYTFYIDARAAILVTTNSLGELEAGVPFSVHVEAMDAGATILDEFYGEFIEFSTNLDHDQVIMPAGAVPLNGGVGDFTITVMDETDNFCLYVREEGGRIDNIGHGEGPYVVVAPTIDAPDGGVVEDSPEDQGNYIDLYCEFSDNDPASPFYDPDLVGYNYVNEYRWYKDTGEYLVLIAQTPQDDNVDMVYERYNTQGDITEYDYYVAAWSFGNNSGPITTGFNDAVEAFHGKQAAGHAPGVFYALGHPDALVGDIIRVTVGDYPASTDREDDYSSPLVAIGSARPYDNIPPMAVSDFTIEAVGLNALLTWSEVIEGINGSLEVNPVSYNIYRGTTVNEIEELIANVAELSLEDLEVIGDPALNYFYQIAAADWDNESERSVILGEFDYALNSAEGTDWNYIGMPIMVDYTDAEGLVTNIAGTDGAADWVASEQGWDTWAPTRSNFDLNAGHAYLVNYPGDETVHTFTGEAVLDVNFELVVTTTTDWNDLAVPLTETGITSLGDLVDAIECANAAALFNTAAQSWYVYYEGFPEEWNRPLTVGDALLVNATAECTWPIAGLGRGNGTIFVEDEATDAPHLVWGNVFSPNEGTISATAYVLGRESDVLTTADFAVQVSDGFWAVQVGDFTHPWRSGEVVRIEFRDDSGFGANCDVTLGWNVADNGGNLVMEELPTVWALHQNYPNPFNPTTVIPFDLVDRTNVEITIYNMLGKKVATVLNENLPAGHHEITWNGRNAYGSDVASGVYFVQMQAADFVSTNKLMKVK